MNNTSIMTDGPSIVNYQCVTDLKEMLIDYVDDYVIGGQEDLNREYLFYLVERMSSLLEQGNYNAVQV
ncbi:MAG: hypothetical protein COA78_17495 [Blastopirellula sp.]|nr:MAG: hypothetical protein COA78_17495 [Blastopirellula sp.]